MSKGPGGAKKKFTREQVISAFRATGGFVTHAAKELGCCYETIGNYIKDDPSIGVELQQIRDSRLDIAESVIVDAMEGDDKPLAVGTAKFYLKYKGRGRGYIKATKVEVGGDLSKMMREADERVK